MARWSSLLSKVWIHSSLICLHLEVEGHSEQAAQSLLAPWSSDHLVLLRMKEEEREAKKYAFFSCLSYNGDTQLLRKISSNSYFLNSIVIILTIFLWLLLNGPSCMQAHTKISLLLLCLRTSLEVPFRLHCRFSRLKHSIIILYQKHFPISLTLH